MQLPQTTPPCPLSGGQPSREGARGRDRHPTSQSKDPDFRGKKVRAMKKWAYAMVSGNTVQWSQPYAGDVRRGCI